MTDLNLSGPPRETIFDGKPQNVFAALKEVWASRRLLMFMLLRDVRGRYRSTWLGNWWVLVRPLIELLPYLVVFGLFLNLRPGPVPYILFLLAGFAPWLLLRASASSAPGLLGKSRSLLKKVYFPRLILPLNAMILALLDFAVVTAGVVVLTFAFGFAPDVRMLALPLFMLLALALGLGEMLVIAAACLKRPDIAFGVQAAIRIVFYGSPIVYPLSVVPEAWRPFFDFNPVTAIVEGFRWALFGLDPPTTLAIASSVSVAVVSLVIGVAAFLHAERTLADVL